MRRRWVWYSTRDSKVRRGWASDLPGKVLRPCTWMPKRHVEKHWFAGTVGVCGNVTWGPWGAGYLWVLCVLNPGGVCYCSNPRTTSSRWLFVGFWGVPTYFDWLVFFVLWGHISRLTIRKKKGLHPYVVPAGIPINLSEINRQLKNV